MQKTIRQTILIVIDAISVILALYGSLVLRFNGLIEKQYLDHANALVIIVVALSSVSYTHL